MNKQVKATILALDNCNFHVKECIAFTVIYLVILVIFRVASHTHA